MQGPASDPIKAGGGGGGDKEPPTPLPMKSADANAAAMMFDMFFPGHVAFWQVLYAITTTLLGWWAVTVEVFIRHQFGERYFSLLKFLLASCLLGMYVWLGSFAALLGNQWSPSLILLWWAFMAASLLHLLDIQMRNWLGVVWHSQSYGLSWLSPLVGARLIPILPWRLTDWQLYRIIEPALCAILALLLYYLVDRPLGTWLGLAALALFVRNNLAYAQARGRLLDLLDARIEATATASALEGKSKRQTYGVSIVQVPRPVAAEVKALADVAAASPPDFTALLESRLRPTRDSAALPADPPAAVSPAGPQALPPPGTPPQAQPAAAAAAPAARRAALPAPRLPLSFGRGGSLLAVLIFGGLLIASGGASPARDAEAPPAGEAPAAGLGGLLPAQPQPTAPRPTAPPESGGFSLPGSGSGGEGVGGSSPPVPTLADIAPAGDALAGPTPTFAPTPTPLLREYNVISQRPQAGLSVISASQGAGALNLTLEYVPADDTPIGLDFPGDPNAFYLLAGGERYDYTLALGIVIGRDDQAVTPGEPVRFTLTFPPLPDPTQPFDLIEGAGERTEGVVYWDVLEIQLEAAR